MARYKMQTFEAVSSLKSSNITHVNVKKKEEEEKDNEEEAEEGDDDDDEDDERVYLVR